MAKYIAQTIDKYQIIMYLCTINQPLTVVTLLWGDSSLGWFSVFDLLTQQRFTYILYVCSLFLCYEFIY